MKAVLFLNRQLTQFIIFSKLFVTRNMYFFLNKLSQKLQLRDMKDFLLTPSSSVRYFLKYCQLNIPYVVPLFKWDVFFFIYTLIKALNTYL